ncbi:MAG TPA: IS4 family transposase, partial [Desulfotomaculum sp.]|nr:IS4 family transposase [Desulfotomaculum sp.]
EPGSPIEKDSIDSVGNKGMNKMQHPLRLLKTNDTKGNPVVSLKNDFKLSAGQIGGI